MRSVDAAVYQDRRYPLTWIFKIHNATLTSNVDPRGRPTLVITIFTYVLRPYILTDVPTFEPPQNKTIFNENSDRYWRGYGSGRVDHW